MSVVSEIALGDACCRYLTSHHYENFWAVTLLAPPAARLHLRRLYTYCRLTDDLGDEQGELAAARLALWRDDLERCFTPGLPPSHPALAALAATIAQYRLPPEPFFDLIDANLQDQRVHCYETWQELREYCRRSAAPVGRLVLHLFGAATPKREQLSDDVCIGLQLANFAQDVRVDRAKGRTYLLQPDLREQGMAGAVRMLCDRASGLLASGLLLEASVGGRLGLQLALYRLGGEAILRAIAAVGYRTDRRRPEVPTTVKLGLVALAGKQALRRSRHAGAERTA